MKGLQFNKNLASSYGLQYQKGQAMKGLQLIASSYGLQHQKHQKASNERITANREQL